MGADDYLPKPFEPKELILRIKSILKRTQIRERKRVISFSKIKIDLNKLFIFKDNEQYKKVGAKIIDKAEESEII